MKNLHPGSILALGVAFGLILLAYGFFHQWMPKTTEASARRANAAALRDEAAKIPQAYKKIEKLNTEVRTLESQWNAIVAVKTPPNDVSRGGINVNQQAWQLAVDTVRYRNNVQRAVNAQVIKGGVKLISAPLVPGIGPNDPVNGLLANYYNYPAIPFPVVLFDLGQVEVEGTYEQILANVRSWTNMPRYLAVADGLALRGTAPRLRGTYNVSIVGYIRTNGIFP
ncbi:MAG: hypothetical protein C4320_08070, partial [Armatimonadota bacterium]